MEYKIPVRREIAAMPYREELNKVSALLGLSVTSLYSDSLSEAIRELTVAKLCQVLGLKCAYNYKSDFFSSIAGEVIANKLNIGVAIASPCLKFYKHDGVNLITRALELYDSLSLDELFLELFDLADRHKHLIEMLKRLGCL